jgi:hypothetical protein
MLRRTGEIFAQQMVTKLEGISAKGWSAIAEKEYEKHHYPNDSHKHEYTHALETSYQQACTELGSKVAGPRPEQTATGENKDADEAIKKQLKLTPEDGYEFTLAFKFNLWTKKGKPVWRCPSYQFKAKGYYNAGSVVVDEGKIIYSTERIQGTGR